MEQTQRNESKKDNFFYFNSFTCFKRKNAQITTLFVVVLGVLLFLTTIVIDMGQVAGTKAQMDIAVDSGALQLGSMLTSHAKMLSDQGLKGRVQRKKSSFWAGKVGQILGPVAMVVGAVLAPFTGGWSLLLTAAGTAAFGHSMRQSMAIKAMASSLKMLNTDEARYREHSLFTVVSGIVDDRKQVVDVHDIGRTGRTDTWINRFQLHLDTRMRALVIDGDTSLLESYIEEIIDNLEELNDLIYANHPEDPEFSCPNASNLRDFLKEDTVDPPASPLGLWEVFLRLDEPDYNEMLLQSRIADANPYYTVRPRTGELSREKGYETTHYNDVSGCGCSGVLPSLIWDKDDPHAEENNLLPVSPESLCQISYTIYDILYVDPDLEPEDYVSVTALLDFLLEKEWYSKANLITSGQMRRAWAEDIHGDLIDDYELPEEGEEGEEDSLIIRLLPWIAFIEGWIDFLANEKLPELEDDIDVLQADIDDLNVLIGELTVEINLLTSQINSLTSQINSLTSQINNLTTRINDIQAIIDEYGDEDGSLQDQIDSLAAQRSSRISQRSSLISERSALISERSALRNERSILRALRNQIRETQEVLEDLYSDIEEAIAILSDYRSNLVRIRNNLEEKSRLVYDWHFPETVNIGELMYIWRSNSPREGEEPLWHVAEARVADDELKAPKLETKTKKRTWKREFYAWISPYSKRKGGRFEQQFEIKARKFNPVQVETGWWDFYPSRQLGEGGRARWQAISDRLEALDNNPFIHDIAYGGGMIGKGGDEDPALAQLYDDIASFLDDYGIVSEAVSHTTYVNRFRQKSDWQISVLNPR